MDITCPPTFVLQRWLVLLPTLPARGAEPTLATWKSPEPTPYERYEEPKVVDYGDLTELTAGAVNGNFLDKSFPAGTPKDELTFS
jgi:hypothetical protein